jgi:hypothetical protein
MPYYTAGPEARQTPWRLHIFLVTAHKILTPRGRLPPLADAAGDSYNHPFATRRIDGFFRFSEREAAPAERASANWFHAASFDP